MTINERIAVLIKNLGLNPNSFSNKIGVSSTVVHNILKARNNPGFDVVQKILFSFENINSEWLLMEKGDMFKENIRVIQDKEKNKVKPLTTSLDWYVKKDIIMKVLKASIKDFDKSYEYLSSLDIELEIAVGHIENFYSHVEDAIGIFADKKLAKKNTDSLVAGTKHLIEPVLDLALFYSNVLPVLKEANEKYRTKYKDHYETPKKNELKKQI